MAPRFHLLSAELFVDSVPGDAPTDEDCKKFRKPELHSKMSEHELYPELAAVVQSVLDMAGCDALRFLDTANHKAKDGNAGKKDTFNDGGIYMNSPLAREATEFTSEHRDKSQMTPEQLAQRRLGLRSWNWIDILFEVKRYEKHAAFYFTSKPRGYKNIVEASAPAADLASGALRHGGAADPSSKRNMDDIATSSKGKAIAHDGPSIPDAAAADHLSAGDHGTEETKGKPSMTTRQVPPFVKLSEGGEEALGQFVEYMLNVQKNQHRIFSYAVYVCYDMARLLYFDRSGAFVSEPFRWDETDSLLHQFVWKITKLANAGRFEDLGHDPTAELASGEAKDKFLALKDDMSLPPHIRNGFKEATADKWPIYRLEVAHGEPSKDEWFDDITFPPPKNFSSPPTPSPSHSTTFSKPSSSSDPLPSSSDNFTPSVRHFLVGRPHFAADGLVGRCTRGYFAYDITDTDKKNWRVCFLKDSWRPVVPGHTRPEHLVYQRLRFCGVNRGIGTLICGGDVGDHWAQRTRVQEHLPEKNRPVLRVHYRLVIEEIGIPLEDFNSFPELSAIFVDAIQAHHKAWTLAHVLHRDISVGNIMILPRGNNSPQRRRGILIDWDLSRLECELGTGPVEPDRTGTWQFRSALSLLYPWKPYKRSDDVESFIHVYLYLVFRYHFTDVDSLKDLVMTLFEGVSLVHGIKIGGTRKRTLFTASEFPFQLPFNPELQTLLDSIISECSQSYKRIDFDEMRRRYGFGLPSPQPLPEPPAAPRTAVVDFDSDDDIPRFMGRRNRRSDKAAPVANKDPCVVEGFLSEVGDLIDLLKEHAAVQLPYSDKACDQFPARKHEDVYRGPNDAGNRRIGSMSTSGTLLSQRVSSNASGSAGLSFGSNPGSNFRAAPSTFGTSSDSNLKKRARTKDPVEEATASAEDEPSDSVHRSKRAK
ncbi:hypothetical protein LXA43DRAFT_1076771 [Ganoderma leucocontextum]|nr:hypothetical protein LXA43DRAFT_1076771 [Ganoderma leucocontextum]